MDLGSFSSSTLNPFIDFLGVNFIDDGSTRVFNCFINYICCFPVTAGGYCHPCGIEWLQAYLSFYFILKLFKKCLPTALLPSAMEGPLGTVQWSKVVNIQHAREEPSSTIRAVPSGFCFWSEGTNKKFQSSHASQRQVFSSGPNARKRSGRKNVSLTIHRKVWLEGRF